MPSGSGAALRTGGHPAACDRLSRLHTAPVALEERCAELLIRRLHDGETHRMLHACAGHVVGAIEGHGVAEDDAAAAKRGAERIVGGHGAALEAFRLGERCPARRRPRRDREDWTRACRSRPVATATADRGETPFVHVDDDDPVADRTCRHRAPAGRRRRARGRAVSRGR